MNIFRINGKDLTKFCICFYIGKIKVGIVTCPVLKERIVSVVECLTLDRGFAGPSLTGVTALCP